MQRLDPRVVPDRDLHVAVRGSDTWGLTFVPRGRRRHPVVGVDERGQGAFLFLFSVWVISLTT